MLHATPTTETYTLSLHDALPISTKLEYSDGEVVQFVYDDKGRVLKATNQESEVTYAYDNQGRVTRERSEEHTSEPSHVRISYAVFCLKKKKKQKPNRLDDMLDTR